MGVRSKCINCNQQRACIKVEARAPLPHGPVLVWDDRLNCHQQVDYEEHGPMVEICRSCMEGDFGTLARYLLESL